MSSKPSGLPELLPALHALSRVDKLRAIQHLAVDLAVDLAGDLAGEEGGSFLQLEAGLAYPVWTPHGAEEAGAALLKALAAEGNAP